MAANLGRLLPVDPREIWPTEDSDFTPWLAQPENLELLGEAIGVELEHEATEKNVGPFRADILCKDAATGHWVLIENQLGRTDHIHLGQLLTYAAGLEAATIVWIARPFTQEHQAALTWLNQITDERFNFFGLEVEVWRIGESPPASKLNVVVKPNDWTRTISEVLTRTVSPTKQMYEEYWQEFRKFLELRNSIIKPRKPLPQQWTEFSVGRSYCNLIAAFSVHGQQLRVHLALLGPDAKAFFHLLSRQRPVIDAALGEPPEWREMPDKIESQIGWKWQNVDPLDRADWARQHQLLAERLETLSNVFRPRVKELDPDDWKPVDNHSSETSSHAARSEQP